MKLVSCVHSFCSLSLLLNTCVESRNQYRGPGRSDQSLHSDASQQPMLICEIINDDEVSTNSTQLKQDVGSGMTAVAPPRNQSSVAPSPSLVAGNSTSSDISSGVSSSGSSQDSDDQALVQESKPAVNATSIKLPVLKANETTESAYPSLWAGACVATLPRVESIPGRTYYNAAGSAKADPLETLAGTGMNAVRVGPIERGQCLGPTDFSKLNNASTLPQELNFELDFGCIDVQVKLAQRALKLKMKIVLTLNMGQVIPKEWEGLGYSEMVDEIQKETKRQIQPFLDNGILPDIILLDNEGTDGVLFKEESSGHLRGVDKSADLDRELCGLKPTGNMASFAQLAGYYKARILAVNDAIQATGLSDSGVRFGLHSHGQYVDWKEGAVHGTNKVDENRLLDSAGKSCAQGISTLVPTDVNEGKVDEMLTIAGFSAYPDPMTPTDINDSTSRDATFNRLRKTLALFEDWAKQYGSYTDGPFKGQSKLQALGVEYATAFDPVKEVQQHVAETEQMWKVVAGHEIMIGMLWWEPWYCRNNWEQGKATLCRHDETNFWPTDVMTAFGKGLGS